MHNSRVVLPLSTRGLSSTHRHLLDEPHCSAQIFTPSGRETMICRHRALYMHLRTFGEGFLVIYIRAVIREMSLCTYVYITFTRRGTPSQLLLLLCGENSSFYVVSLSARTWHERCGDFLTRFCGSRRITHCHLLLRLFVCLLHARTSFGARRIVEIR